MKKYLVLILVVLGFAIFVWQTNNIKHSVFDVRTDTTDTAATAETILKPAPPYIKINNLTIPVELAQTKAEVEKGLSGRVALAADKGMLFVFNKPDYYNFWMPNMNFPIDIIWLAQNKVVDIDENVSNAFDPKNPKFYKPSRPVDRVLEVNAGFAEARNIKIGDTVGYFLNHD